MYTKICCVILSCLLICLMITACGDNNEIIREYESPDGEYEAVYFIRDMGPTTKASYQLRVLKEGKNLGNVSGNIFVTYGEFDVAWENENTLIVTIKTDSEIFKQVTEYKDIIIKYDKNE